MDPITCLQLANEIAALKMANKRDKGWERRDEFLRSDMLSAGAEVSLLDTM